jgi:hypothetical protein
MQYTEAHVAINLIEKRETGYEGTSMSTPNTTVYYYVL